MKKLVETAGQCDDRYISKVEMARRLDVTSRTIESWMERKKVPYEKIGRTVRFHWGHVKEYLQRHSQVSTPSPVSLHPTSSTEKLRELAIVIRTRKRIGAGLADATLPTARAAGQLTRTQGLVAWGRSILLPFGWSLDEQKACRTRLQGPRNLRRSALAKLIGGTNAMRNRIVWAVG